MQKKILIGIVIIIFLLVFAFLLGSPASPFFKSKKVQAPKANINSEGEQTPEQKENARLLLGELTLQEQAVLSPPGPEAGKDAQEEYFRLVVASAKETGRIALNNCTAAPLVLRIKKGEAFALTNHDSKPHGIFITAERQYFLRPQETMQITADFGAGGVYGYGCDSHEKAIGMILLTED